VGIRALPSGTVTFLFTDVEGSTKLLHALGAEEYAQALAAHRRQLREAFAAHAGVEVDTQGDAFFVAFPTAPGALAAALDATRALMDGPIRVRIGLHTGTPLLTDEGYVGPDVHKGARIAAAGHGGQVLVSAATAALVGGASLRDLGQHRLKDLTAPERIFQADPDEHPPLKTLHQTNLPIPPTAFLGRAAELSEVTALLARDDARLVTLIGPGGTGKTRLALQAAADAADRYSDGVWWVALAALRDPELVLPTAATALGATGDLAEHIGDRRMLLLFDNFEQVVVAAPAVASLLTRCPHVQVLVTSRESLHVAGEWEYAVDPLERSDAVELFVTRAVAAKRDFGPDRDVARICERLDDLPLAIELAAARVTVLTPEGILERLEHRLPLLASGHRDVPQRQRTLRATIEWSHELLTETEQRLFRRLAVFRGGCTLPAAEVIAGADLDTLQSLVEKSLVRLRDGGRFWMLETIREFAAERLETSGEATEVRDRHADHFASLVEDAEPHVLRDDEEWVRRLAADHDNVRGALDHLVERADFRRTARLAAAMWRFWYLRNHFHEGLRRFDAVLGLDATPSADRAAILRGASVMALNIGDTARGLTYATAARDMDAELGHTWGMAYSTMMIGNCYSEAPDGTRDLERAAACMVESAALFEEAGDPYYALISKSNRAWIVGELGDPAAEKRIHEEALVEARRIGNAGIEANSLAQLGMAASSDGDHAHAASLIREALVIDHRRDMVVSLATNLGRLAYVLAHQGDSDRAARLLGAEEGLCEAHGAELPWWAMRRKMETQALIQQQCSEADLQHALTHGRSMSVAEAVALALE
jgi:predicted ATPase/class 3 adenylate cyclase